VRGDEATGDVRIRGSSGEARQRKERNVTKNMAFAGQSIELLTRHCQTLDSFSNEITTGMAAKRPLGITAVDVLKEIADTTQTCSSVIEFFADDDPIPGALLNMIKTAQQAIVTASNGLILIFVIANK
jgi:hypothetical protein